MFQGLTCSEAFVNRTLCLGTCQKNLAVTWNEVCAFVHSEYRTDDVLFLQ